MLIYKGSDPDLQHEKKERGGGGILSPLRGVVGGTVKIPSNYKRVFILAAAGCLLYALRIGNNGVLILQGKFIPFI